MFRAARAGVLRFRAPLRIADVRRMWISDVLSVLGDHAAILALGVLIYSQTHSAIAVAVISAAAFAPAFGVGPMLATLADRYPYRSVMIICDVIRAAAYCVILVPGLPVPVIIAIVFAAHCATFPFTAARGAQLPAIAGEQYGAAQALSQSTLQLGALLGFAAGAGLVGVAGARGALAVDAASFLVSAVLIGALSARARTTQDDIESQPSAVSRMRAGARTLRGDPLLFWPAMIVTIAIVGATAADAMAVIVVHTVSGARPGQNATLLALLLILPVLVTITTTLVCPTDGDPYRLVQLSGWMAIGSHGVAIVALMFVHQGGVGVVAAATAYACLGVSSALTVPCVSVVGRRLPADNRASVFALLEALLIGGQASGALLAGWTATHFGAGHGIAILLVPAIPLSVLAIARLQQAAHRSKQPTATALPNSTAPKVEALSTVR
jgi:MFS family permease